MGLKVVAGEVAPGAKGNCAHDLVLETAEYTFRLEKPLGNRIVVEANGDPVAISS